MFEVDRIRKINGLIVGGGGGGAGLGGDGLGGLSLCSSAWLLILICAQPRSHSSGAGNTLGALHVIMGFYPSNMLFV